MGKKKKQREFQIATQGISDRDLKNLDKEYGEGNWNLKGGKGYAASGTVKQYGKAYGGYKDQTVYHKLDVSGPKKENKKQKSKNKNQNQKPTTSATVTQPTNKYQSQITDTLAQIGGQNNVQLPAVSGTPDLRTADNSDAIATLTQTIADQSAKYEQQLQDILDQQAAAEEQRKRQAEMEERKRQMEARVAQANARSAGAETDFRINKEAYEKQRTGTDFFKRRGRIGQNSSSDLLQILARNTINI